ncbi:16S rRNA (uracil(1498)-N(3))-methyltransferase [Luteolibacter yonseiensis]|uniref:Ribosomal RNA small subunit methyltransferase E n=1 Tax=Luteolibacter yonseiensis TaxID=1144680 RepID=A0A934R598_9BACT|nr:RsmE family RNA methyltransferase [Luteolibacter yonseiensis]MBK1815419.1 16S rRNA (uracil(1498)-N(3))-methyltransferase [Luteolibacter yonseiensis]
MARFFLPPGAWLTEPTLVGDEARHFSQVLRGRAGEKIIIFDGEGRRASAEALSVSRDHVPLKIGEILPSRSPMPAITLAQAIPKGKNMDLIVQKSVELGITAIQPLVTRNTIVQPGDGKSEKWRRNALEACKQCGQDTLPQVADPLTFERWISDQAAAPGLKLIASLAPDARPFRSVLRDHPGTTHATLLVGPEGDFTAEETQAASDAGFFKISLGEIVLRVETATIFCLAALRYEFQ